MVISIVKGYDESERLRRSDSSICMADTRHGQRIVNDIVSSRTPVPKQMDINGKPRFTEERKNIVYNADKHRTAADLLTKDVVAIMIQTTSKSFEYGNPPREALHPSRWAFDKTRAKVRQSNTRSLSLLREITPPPGFLAIPITTTMFAATTPENTPMAYRASTSANPNPVISPAFVEANYEALESVLRDWRWQMRNNDLRTKL
ncbi:hypothetical protein Tco_0011192 [Tanacetum coccineum]